jgi:hypothetical protein
MSESLNEITVETERTYRVSHRFRPKEAWCDSCGGSAMWLSPEQANAVSDLSIRAICRAVEAGSLHFIESPAGLLFICLTSLLPMTEIVKK